MRNLLSFHKKPKWQPGANTLAYRPLTDDFNDHSGNSYNLTRNSVSLTTLSGVKCANLNSSYCYANFNLTSLPYTISFYLKPKSTSNTISVCFDDNGSRGGSGIYVFSDRLYLRYGNPTDKDSSTSYTINTNWNHIVATFGTDGSKIYVNGSLFASPKNSLSSPYNNSAPFYIGHDYGNGIYGNSYVGSVILENKVRTAQEVSGYYNLTKSDYGISESQASSCFLAGTPVLIEGGSKPIDELNIGDTVLSYNKSTGEKEYNKVVDIIEHTETKDLLYTLNIEGQRIEATEFHKFYISDNKEDWRREEIRNLKEGQWIFSIGGAKKINSVESKKFDGPCYNITVDNNHNYFVYDGILVHNVTSAS